MRSRKYLLSILGTSAVVAIGAGAATAATGSKTAPSKPAAPRVHMRYGFGARRNAPRSSSGNCPGMGSGAGSSSGSGSGSGSAFSPGAAGPAPSGSI